MPAVGAITPIQISSKDLQTRRYFAPQHESSLPLHRYYILRSGKIPDNALRRPSNNNTFALQRRQDSLISRIIYLGLVAHLGRFCRLQREPPLTVLRPWSGSAECGWTAPSPNLVCLPLNDRIWIQILAHLTSPHRHPSHRPFS